MTNDAKAVFTVDVNDEAVKKLVALVNKYHEAVKQTPDAWRDVSKAATEAAKASAAFSEVGKTNNDDVKTLADTWQSVGRNLNFANGGAATLWTTFNKIGSTVATIAKYIAGLGLGLAGFGAIGIGAPLWLMDRLGSSAGATRMSATGLGVSPASAQAFGLDFGTSISDPNSLLGNVSQKQLNLSDSRYFAGMGISGYQTMSPDQLAIKIMERFRQQFAGKPFGAMQMALAQAEGYDQFLDSGQMRQLATENNTQFQADRSKYQHDIAGGLNTPGDTTLLAWQQFTQQMQRAGEQIENTFIKGLLPLTGPLTQISKSFSDAAKAMLSSPQFADWIRQIDIGLEAFAKYLKSEDFQKDMKTLEGAFTGLADATWLAVKAMNGLYEFFHHAPATEHGRPWGRGGQPLYQAQAFTMYSGNGTPTLTDATYMVPGGPGDGAGFLKLSGSNRWAGIEAQNGLPAGFLTSIEHTESNFNPRAVSPAGAMGAFQFMPDTARQFGIDPFNEQQSAAAAGKYFNQLLKEFGGNLQEATAAYNWGQGNVERALRDYGGSWLQHAPRETQNYVQRVLGGGGGSSGGRSNVTIRIENNTGGSAIVSTNQIQA